MFIGPRPDSIERMGDKAQARDTMAAAGVPVVPGSAVLAGFGQVAELAAQEIGYPVLLKATAGGGGRGMRFVPSAEELETAFDAA